ncbi:Uncharacterised protein [Legionella wadsworthii]|uniref:Uncharacterized protein n=1 Tax=Legionella wadsworthii TaxID=28088 RepID=A0A378LP91_9GAMM|nr:hypothetical protein [Legionella wadsworthii]STY28574.1 Uncharacterised protein [Legionella wadsworthii]
MYSKKLKINKRNVPMITEDFSADFEIIIKKLSGIKVDTARYESVKRLNDRIREIRESDLSKNEKIFALLDVFESEYAFICKSFGGSKSKLGLFLKNFCVENFGVLLNEESAYHILPEGLMMRILDTFTVKSPEKESLLPPISKRSTQVDHISISAPTIGSQPESNSRVSSSLNILEADKEKIGQQTLRSSKELTRLGSMFGSTQFCYAEKPSGVEPGFRAVELDDLFFVALAKILKEAPNKKLQDLAAKLASPEKELHDRQVLFSTFIQIHVKGPHVKGALDPDVQWLCTQVKTAVSQNNELKAWMYKLDYAEGQKNRIKANKEAIREFVGTRFAGIFSAQNQRQEISWVTNAKGEVHALLACGWKNGLEELTKYLYAGSGPDYNGVLVEDKKASVKRSKYIPGLAKNLIFGVGIGDRDGMGKDAQNKGFADEAFYGFDYGKPYEGDGVAASLSDDFSFKDTFARAPSLFRSSSTIGVARHFMYRNYNVFYDTALSERMFGFHLFKKMITGENPNDEVMDSYPGLREELKRIEDKTPTPEELLIDLGRLREQSGKDSKLRSLIDTQTIAIVSGKLSNFDLYFARIKLDLLDMGMQHGIPYDELSGYLEFIEEMEETARKSNQHILNTFEKRSVLTAEEIDCLDQLEKYFSPASVMSPDGAVFLNWMRLDPQSGRIPFQLKKEENGTFTLTTTDKNIANQLKEEFGLVCKQDDAGLSCVMAPDAFARLMKQAEKKYHEKRDGLLIKPTYKFATLPNVVAFINQGKSALDSGVDASFMWRDDNSLSLRIIVTTEKQAEHARRLFKTEFKLNETKFIQIPSNMHAHFQKRVERLHEDYVLKGKEKEAPRESVISMLPYSKEEISPPESNKWNALYRKSEKDITKKLTPDELLMQRLEEMARKGLLKEEYLEELALVIRETDFENIYQLLSYNDETLSLPQNIHAILKEQFDKIQVIEDRTFMTEPVTGNGLKQTFL